MSLSFQAGGAVRLAGAAREARRRGGAFPRWTSPQANAGGHSHVLAEDAFDRLTGDAH